jgi:DNA-binding transcriptional LysR family regulator
MDFRWLETFSVVARESSLSSAAAELGYARSTVTYHIQNLERAVGARLLDRELAGQPLTPSGLVLLEHAEAALTHIGKARTKVARVAGTGSKVVRLAVTESTATYRLAMFLRGLQRHLPNMKIDVEVTPEAAIRDKLRRGQREVALLCTVPTESDDQYGRRHLWDERPVMVSVAGAADRLGKVLVTQRGCIYRDIIDSEFLPSARPMKVVQIGSVEAVKAGVLAGLGVGLIPLIAARPWLSGGQLVLLDWQPTRRVATDVQWNREFCLPTVIDYLERLTAPRIGSDIPATD